MLMYIGCAHTIVMHAIRAIVTVATIRQFECQTQCPPSTYYSQLDDAVQSHCTAQWRTARWNTRSVPAASFKQRLASVATKAQIQALTLKMAAESI